MTDLQGALVEVAHLRYKSAYPDEMWRMVPLETAILAMRLSKEFDTDKYLAMYPDVQKAGVEPIEHFMRFGADEKRVLSRTLYPAEENLEASANERLNDIIYDEYESQCPLGAKNVPAMLKPMDRAIYYYYASRHPGGDSAIIDAGCLIGGTTMALLAGLKERADVPRIEVYDIFKCEGYIRNFLNYWCPDASPDLTSIRPLFDANVRGHECRLQVFEGDLCVTDEIHKKPIYFFGVDCCKAVGVTDTVIRYFYPALMPGISYVVHQDYVHGWLPHIHISMELLSDYFRPVLESREAASYVFQPIAPITGDVVKRIFGERRVMNTERESWYTCVERNDALLQKVVDKMITPFAKSEVGCARAWYLRQMGMDERAKRVINGICEDFPEIRRDQGLVRLVRGQ